MIIGQELIHIVSAPTLFFMEIKSVMRKGVMRKGVRHLGKFSFAERGQAPPVICSFSLNWTWSLFGDNFTHFLFEKVEKR